MNKEEKLINAVISKLKSEGLTKSNYKRLTAESILSYCVSYGKLTIALLENEETIISKLD